jgi:hypothetical protein
MAEKEQSYFSKGFFFGLGFTLGAYFVAHVHNMLLDLIDVFLATSDITIFGG